jgi:hypothetical protein
MCEGEGGDTEERAGCDYFVLSLNQPLVELARKRMELFEELRQDDDVSEIRYWCGGKCYYRQTEKLDFALGRLVASNMSGFFERGGWLLLPDEFKLDAYTPEGTDCEEMVIVSGGVCWSAMPKFTGVTVVSQTISMRDLEDFLGGKQTLVLRSIHEG